MIFERRIIQGEATDWWVTRGTCGQISSWPWGKDVWFSFIFILGFSKFFWFLLRRSDGSISDPKKAVCFQRRSTDRWNLSKVLVCCASESKKVCDQRIEIWCFFSCFFLGGLGVVFGNLECGGVSLSLKFLSFLVSRVRMWPFAPGSVGSDFPSSMSFLATLRRFIGLEIFWAPWNLFGNYRILY